MPGKEYLSVEEICSFLEICPSTLYSWIKTCPDFPKRRKLGFRRNIFLTREVEEWVASRPMK